MDLTAVCGHQNNLRTSFYLLAGMLLLSIQVSGQNTTTRNTTTSKNQEEQQEAREKWTLTLAGVQSIGPSAVFLIPTNNIRDLTDDVVKYLLDAISTGTDYNLKGISGTAMGNTSVMALATDKDTARLKAFCQRAFQLYESAEDINSNEGWKNIKYLLFCAPPKVWSSVNETRVQRDNISVTRQPWVCKIQEMSIDEQFSKILKMVQKLFPENEACGKSLAAKLLKGGITSAGGLKSLGSLSNCIDSGSMKTVIDSSCDLAIKALQENRLDSKMASYVVKKCATIPKTFQGATCASIGNDLGVFLPYMELKFFKDLPQNLLCDQQCLKLFKESGSMLKDLMSFVMRTCFDRA